MVSLYGRRFVSYVEDEHMGKSVTIFAEPRVQHAGEERSRSAPACPRRTTLASLSLSSLSLSLCACLSHTLSLCLCPCLCLALSVSVSLCRSSRLSAGVSCAGVRVWEGGLRVYRGTSLIRKRAPLGPYSGTMQRALRWSQRGGAVSFERGTPVGCRVQDEGCQVRWFRV